MSHPRPDTVGGCSAYSYIAAASANQDSQVVDDAQGQLYGVQVFNVANATRYVKLYDKATAPTSADTPVFRYAVGAASGRDFTFPFGVAFTNGIAHRITTGQADNDTGAATAGDVVVNLQYK